MPLPDDAVLPSLLSTYPMDQARRILRNKAAWQPLDMLPFVAALIDEGLARGQALDAFVEKACADPSLLTDEKADAFVAFFDEEADLLVFFESQVTRWTNAPHAPSQAKELRRVEDVLRATRQVVKHLQWRLEELHRTM